MPFPAFFDEAPRLTVRDPLAAFLGAAEEGIIEYGYADAVNLAGHSCPTVAGAYLMTVNALRRLYAGALPVRGEVEVFLRDEAEDGVAGVIAGVATLLTGAARETGFKGIAGRFDRRNLLAFGADIGGELAFRRRDTGVGVQALLDTGVAPVEPEMRDLLGLLIAGRAGADETSRFQFLWQDRVRRLLIEHADDPNLVRLVDWAG